MYNPHFPGKVSIFFFLLTAACTLHCFAFNDSITYEGSFGGMGFIPGVRRNGISYLSSSNSILMHQSHYWKMDDHPFPAKAQGIFGDFLINKRKVSIGLGYTFHSDFYTVTNNLYGAGLNAGFSAKIMNHSAYIKALWHRKHDQQSGIYGGIKAGMFMYCAGITTRLGNVGPVLNDETVKHFSVIKYTSVYPGLFAGAELGLKFYFFQNVFRVFKRQNKNPWGIRIFADYLVATRSGKVTVYRLNQSGTKIEEIYPHAKVVLDYSGMRMNLAYFREFGLKEKF